MREGGQGEGKGRDEEGRADTILPPLLLFTNTSLPPRQQHPLT